MPVAKASRKIARRNKASFQGPALGCPGLVWQVVILGSLTLNLVTVALIASDYKRDGPLGFRAESSPPFAVKELEEAESPESDDEETVLWTEEIGVKSTSNDVVINLDHGDPTMYESFWKRLGERVDVLILGWQAMSYFSESTQLCWFLELEFAREIHRLHSLVGNAVVDDRFIIPGTGSTQLFQAALYALSPPYMPEPLSVVSAVPYYSAYPAITDYLQSRLYRWAGDGSTFIGDAYIELVCSPNNPDGSIREAVLNSKNGKMIHDLAYYWPQYTPITGAVDHEIMLFSVSKSTGHAGTRLGWAIVKNEDVAKRMIKFIELNTIGVSKDSQLRAAKILKVVSDVYQLPISKNNDRLFDYARGLMFMRWHKLREAANMSGIFSLPVFLSSICEFTGQRTETYPAFAWLKCEKKGVDDCENFLRDHKILTRSGVHFGMEPKYARVSMLDRDEAFELFIERLSSLH